MLEPLVKSMLIRYLFVYYPERIKSIFVTEDKCMMSENLRISFKLESWPKISIEQKAHQMVASYRMPLGPLGRPARYDIVMRIKVSPAEDFKESREFIIDVDYMYENASDTELTSIPTNMGFFAFQSPILPLEGDPPVSIG
jgi:hypothetical protein